MDGHYHYETFQQLVPIHARDFLFLLPLAGLVLANVAVWWLLWRRARQ